MDLRKAQGREIALLGHASKKGDVWLVRSQTRSGVKYKVNIDDKKHTCTCPDFVANGGKCKHIYGVIYRVEFPDAGLVDPPPSQVPRKKKPTYPQDWANYNAAQTNEKPLFMELLAGACDFVEDEEATGPGRPRIPRSALLYLMIYKVYEQLSTRRFMSDAHVAERFGYVDAAPHFNSVINGMNDRRMTAELHKLIEITSLPFVALEHTFAADSSGFSVSQYERWQEIKPAKAMEDGGTGGSKATTKKEKGRKGASKRSGPDEMTERDQHIWSKLHLICGVRTHIVTAVVIKDKHASDTRQLPELIERTALKFKIDRLCADKAYGSVDNYKVAAKYGIDPYIPFKSNQTGAGKGRSGREHKTDGGKLWAKKFHEFMYCREGFDSFYHARSNVETVFSMIKRNLGAAVRSKSEQAMLNEVLCKIVCHNILCIVKATFELGLETEELRRARPKGWNPRVIDGGRDSHEPLRPA